MNHAVDWVRTLGGLLVVLAMIVVVGWLLRRLQQCAGMGPVGLGWRRSQVITVAAQQILGAREKVVVVDMKGTWPVLGVTQQYVQTLHTLLCPAEVASMPDDPSSDGMLGFGKPPRSADTLSTQFRRHPTGKSE